MQKTIRINDEELLLENFSVQNGTVRFRLNGKDYAFEGEAGSLRRADGKGGLVTGYKVLADAEKGVLYHLGLYQAWVETTPARRRGKGGQAPSDAVYKAPMTGKLLEMRVKEGAKVKEGDKLAVMEAMKLQIAITASRAGVVEAAPLAAGAMVQEGELLVKLKDEAA